MRWRLVFCEEESGLTCHLVDGPPTGPSLSLLPPNSMDSTHIAECAKIWPKGLDLVAIAESLGAAAFGQIKPKTSDD